MSEYDALKDLDKKQTEALDKFLRHKSSKSSNYGFALKKKGIPGYIRELLKGTDMDDDLKGLRIKKLKEDE